MKDDLGPLPQVHPRVPVTAKADKELAEFVTVWIERNGLTASEALSILSHEQTRFLNRCVAIERKREG